MAIVPSSQALQALALLCRPCSTVNRAKPSCRAFVSVCEARRPAVRVVRPVRSWNSSRRHKTTLVDAPEPAVFANDPSKYNPQARTNNEPLRQGTIDPQSDASSPILPDVTNYYTLFPQTLPHGPPAPTSNIPNSSSLTNADGKNDEELARFHISPRELRKEFLQLQSRFHPDKYANGSPAHQRAYALSTLLNNAYKTLSDPLARAQYLLQLQHDIDVTNEDNKAHPTDQDTLMAVMEAQEDLEGLEVDMPRQEAEKVVQRLKEQNNTRIFETEKALAEAFETGDTETARQETVRLNYWMSLRSGLNEWEPGKEVRLTH